MTPINHFLEKGEVRENQVEGIKIERLTVNYLIIKGVLYRKGYSTPYLR